MNDKTKRSEIPEEDKEIMFMMESSFDKWADEIEKHDAKNAELIADFCARHGAARNSHYAAMFSAFLGGMSFGMDLCGKIEASSQQPT